MSFGLSVLLLQSRMCFKRSGPDCHCHSNSWRTRSLAQSLSQITPSGKLPTSEQKNFWLRKILRITKKFRTTSGKCRLNTTHSCFISWMSRFVANCLQIVHLLISELFILQTSVLNAPENTLLATGETFSHDWKFPSCKKHFLFFKDCSFVKTECRKIIWGLLQSFRQKTLNKEDLFINHINNQTAWCCKEINGVNKLTGYHNRWSSKKENTLLTNTACSWFSVNRTPQAH